MHKSSGVRDDRSFESTYIKSAEDSNSAIPPHNKQDSEGYTSPVIKRPSEIPLNAPERKRVYYGKEKETSTISSGQIHARWLVESYLCAKVLGPGGKGIRKMKDAAKEAVTNAWISPKVPNVKFRVFNCIGTPTGISKIAGLFVKSLHDEGDNQSSAQSKYYDLKLLIPVIFVNEMAGTSDEKLHEIEADSNSKISIDTSTFAKSDEKCVHVNGIRDAIQTSICLVLDELAKIYAAAKFDPQTSSLILYAPDHRIDSSNQGELYTPNPRNRQLNSQHLSKRDQAPLPVIHGSANVSSASSIGTPSKGSSPEPLALNNKPFDCLLPTVHDNDLAPESILTAFDIAKDSSRSRLRQMLQVPYATSSKDELDFLVDNIRRVTNCSVETFPADKSELEHDVHLLEDHDEISLVIEGAPSENLLGIFLVYRFLHRGKTR